jgi:iron complex outermembrane receptor protein
MKSLWSLLLVSTALAGLPGLAAAQTPPAGAQAEQPARVGEPAAASAQGSTQTGSSPAAGAQDAQQGLADIVVTAQRRSENVQKSSLAISVVSANELRQQGISSTQDLTKALPGVQIGTAGPTPQIYLRGVGDPGTTAVTNPAVALNVGGVYYARPGAAARAKP